MLHLSADKVLAELKRTNDLRARHAAGRALEAFSNEEGAREELATSSALDDSRLFEFFLAGGGTDMTISLTLACVWVVAAAIVAFLPMRMQYVPGLTLLVLAVPLLVYIGIQHSFWVVLLAVMGLVSMFRRPLWFLGRHLWGRLREGGT
ncbi:DUF2484 family protein [Nioella sp.]|uniref:DUF2484 family protein n=1 Tax=Nioella sp. TaxID=1912091 RepID=UPI003A837CA1